MSDIKIGDKVTFMGGRRGKQEGVVAEIKHPQARMTRKLRGALAFADMHDLDTSHLFTRAAVAHVVVNGLVWKVSTGLLTVVGKGDATKAQDEMYEARDKYEAAKGEVADARWGAIDGNKLANLKAGDQVQVTYTGGVVRHETFVKLSPEGKVGIKSYNKRGVRYINPKFVRPIA